MEAGPNARVPMPNPPVLLPLEASSLSLLLKLLKLLLLLRLPAEGPAVSLLLPPRLLPRLLAEGLVLLMSPLLLLLLPLTADWGVSRVAAAGLLS